MTYETIQTEIYGDVGLIRLNDPAALNAVSAGMFEELDDALNVLSGSCRAMILTGAGRAFCAGANLTGIGGKDATGASDAGVILESHVNPFMMRLRALPIPWISAVRGAAAGVGCSLALAADLVVCSETAFFLQAFANIGLVPDGGSTWLLTQAVGRARAMEMMLLAERIPAAKALEWGLINRVVADDALDAAALELAAKLAKGPTRSLSMIREAAWAATELTFEAALANERRLQREAGRTADHKEGVKAFLGKRPAVFTGG